MGGSFVTMRAIVTATDLSDTLDERLYYRAAFLCSDTFVIGPP